MSSVMNSEVNSIELTSRLVNLYNQTMDMKFNREHFDKNFEKLIEKESDLLRKVGEACSGSDEVFRKICECVPLHVSRQLSKISSKRKRDMTALDYKMNMVSYFVPLMGEIPGDNAKEISECMVKIWNEVMPEYKIGYTDAESIRSGFKRSLCYITTAVCQSQNKPDDCYELTLLRGYRDHYMLQTEDGIATVEQYYNIAPTIVKRIGRRDDASEIYGSIWKDYLQPCITMIENDELEACRVCYTDMVHSLEKKYLYS